MTPPRTMIGVPSPPYATGDVLAIRHSTAARNGLKPSPTMIAPQMATGVYTDTGAASVDGRLIHLASQDFTVLGGSAGEVHSLKVADVMELAQHFVHAPGTGIGMEHLLVTFLGDQHVCATAMVEDVHIVRFQ